MGLRSARAGMVFAALTIAALAVPGGALAAPSNDDFANALTYAPDPIIGHYTLHSNAGATQEPMEPNHAGNPGGSSVWFNITYPVSGPTEVGTCLHTFGEFDTLVAVYTGNAVNAL